MMGNTPLFIITHHDKNQLDITVPGSFTPFVHNTFSHKQEHFSFLPKYKPLGYSSLSPDESRWIMKALAATEMKAAFFSKETIQLAAQFGQIPDGFFLTRFIPRSIGTPKNTDNYTLIEKKAFFTLGKIWSDIARIVRRHHYPNQKMTITLPFRPGHIITQEHIRGWLENNQAYVQSLRQKRLIYQQNNTTQLEEYAKENGTTLIRLKNHPFINQPTITISAECILNASNPIVDKHLYNKLCLRDASLIKGLSINEKHHIKKRAELPSTYPLQIHHIHPITLGGETTLDNLCFIKESDLIRFKQTIEHPVKNYLLHHMGTSRKFFVELPVPLMIYHSFPGLKIRRSITTNTTSHSFSKRISDAKHRNDIRRDRHKINLFLRDTHSYE